MATQEENERDPEWLKMQGARYKDEASSLARERDALAAEKRVLEERLTSATTELLAGRITLNRLSEAQAANAAQLQELRTENAALKAAFTKAQTLATRRRVALAAVVKTVGLVLTTVTPLLDEDQ